MENYIPMKVLLEKTGTNYRLVIMAIQRAKELILQHAKPLISGTEGKKPIIIALTEIHDGKIGYVELKKASKKK